MLKMASRFSGHMCPSWNLGLRIVSCLLTLQQQLEDWLMSLITKSVTWPFNFGLRQITKQWYLTTWDENGLDLHCTSCILHYCLHSVNFPSPLAPLVLAFRFIWNWLFFLYMLLFIPSETMQMWHTWKWTSWKTWFHSLGRLVRHQTLSFWLNFLLIWFITKKQVLTNSLHNSKAGLTCALRSLAT